MKKIFIFLSCLIFGPALGCLLSGFWHSGANTFWKPIDYFPYSVKTIIAMKPFGKEFLVETTENRTYLITYPCSENQTCWTSSEKLSVDFSNEKYVDEVSKDGCKNNNFVYPLFRKITMCITSVVPAPDATYTVSLALTSDNKLWIWDNPYQDPFSVITNMLVITIVSTVIGLAVGIFFLAYNPQKKRKS